MNQLKTGKSLTLTVERAENQCDYNQVDCTVDLCKAGPPTFNNNESTNGNRV